MDEPYLIPEGTCLAAAVPPVGSIAIDVLCMSGNILCPSDFMVYTRGSADDYNRYAEITGDDGWSWNEMLPYILKVVTRIRLLSKPLTL